MNNHNGKGKKVVQYNLNWKDCTIHLSNNTGGTTADMVANIDMRNTDWNNLGNLDLGGIEMSFLQYGWIWNIQTNNKTLFNKLSSLSWYVYLLCFSFV